MNPAAIRQSDDLASGVINLLPAVAHQDHVSHLPGLIYLIGLLQTNLNLGRPESATPAPSPESVCIVRLQLKPPPQPALDALGRGAGLCGLVGSRGRRRPRKNEGNIRRWH